MKNTIIFDFGNVLIRFDPKIMTGAIVKQPKDAALIRGVVFDRLYWDRLDDGSIEDEEVLARACERLPQHLCEQARQVYKLWYHHLPEIEGMRELLHDLKAAGKKLYLLSNISIGFEHGYRSVPALDSLLSLFDGCIFSGSLHMVKPQPEIFAHLLAKYSLRPEDCVFIDDSPINVAGAQNVGIDGILFRGDASEVRRALGA
ncbi:MAG: HAD family phosphatase [Clostridia bacterium]|nr:HAD family phosphatase [Clostridia bacterium]